MILENVFSLKIIFEKQLLFDKTYKTRIKILKNHLKYRKIA